MGEALGLIGAVGHSYHKPKLHSFLMNSAKKVRLNGGNSINNSADCKYFNAVCKRRRILHHIQESYFQRVHEISHAL
jgi:hypothetical protein